MPKRKYRQRPEDAHVQTRVGVEGPGEPPQARAVVRHRGLVLEIVFGDVRGETVHELRLRPDGDDVLEPRALRRFAPDAELYLALARSAMRWDEGETLAAIETLRGVGAPGRGLPDEFYARVAQRFTALVEGGEPHPVKTIAETTPVHMSTASRWVGEARRRGYLPPREGKED